MISMSVKALGRNGLIRLTIHGQIIIQNPPQLWETHNQNK